MEKKSGNFSEFQQLAQSQTGQQLLALLRQTDAAALQTATEKARSGSYSEAIDALSSVLQTPEVRELLRKLGG